MAQIFCVSTILLAVSVFSVSAVPDWHVICDMRSLAVSYANYLQPSDVAGDWGAAAFDGLQLKTQCNLTTPQHAKRQRQDPKDRVVCDLEVFVDVVNGSDLSSKGSLMSPVRTIGKAIRLIRMIRSSPLTPACITIRRGTYYLGDVREGIERLKVRQSDSAVGYISLTAIDSSLTIRSFTNEQVILSGGRQLTPNWTVYANTSAGTIYSTQLPDDLELDWHSFNELIVDGQRAPRARWPNANSSTQGLHTPPATGWIQSARGWMHHPFLQGSTVLISVATPNRSDSIYSNYQVNVGSGATSLYSPPRSFWASGNHSIYPGGLYYNSDDLPKVEQWTNVSQGPGYVHAFHAGRLQEIYRETPDAFLKTKSFFFI
jgi:hypothetical protein